MPNFELCHSCRKLTICNLCSEHGSSILLQEALIRLHSIPDDHNRYLQRRCGRKGSGLNETQHTLHHLAFTTHGKENTKAKVQRLLVRDKLMDPPHPYHFQISRTKFYLVVVLGEIRPFDSWQLILCP